MKRAEITRLSMSRKLTEHINSVFVLNNVLKQLLLFLVVRCLPKLYAPAGGTLQCTKETQYGSECSFACHDGHTMTGSDRRVCEKDPVTSKGVWTGNETKCERTKNNTGVYEGFCKATIVIYTS